MENADAQTATPASDELQSVLREPHDCGDAAFSERAWNAAIRLYLQTYAERPTLN